MNDNHGRPLWYRGWASLKRNERKVKTTCSNHCDVVLFRGLRLCPGRRLLYFSPAEKHEKIYIKIDASDTTISFSKRNVIRQGRLIHTLPTLITLHGLSRDFLNWKNAIPRSPTWCASTRLLSGFVKKIPYSEEYSKLHT